MKKIILPILASCALLLGACTSQTSELSHRMASQGNTILEYSGFGADTKTIHTCMLIALQERQWNIVSSGNPIKAEIVRNDQHAILSISVLDDKVRIETKGSYSKGGAYVPLRYVDFLVQTARKHVYQKQGVSSKSS